MKTFVLQIGDNGHYDPDTAVIADTIAGHNWFRPDDKINIIDCKYEELDEKYQQNAIPVGSIDFVNKGLELSGCPHMKPLNIPESMRTDDLLHRRVLDCSTEALSKQFEVLNSKKLFIKSGDYLKTDFTGIYWPKSILSNEEMRKKFGSTCFVSEEITIRSEWRCFVYKHTLRGLKHYLGDFWSTPNKSFIDKCIELAPNDLIAYTLDVGLTTDGHWVIIELHNFCCCALYGFDDPCIINMLSTAFKSEVQKSKKSDKSMKTFSDAEQFLIEESKKFVF